MRMHSAINDLSHSHYLQNVGREPEHAILANLLSPHSYIFLFFLFFSSAWRRLQARYYRKRQHGQQKLQNFLWAKQVLWKSYGSGTLESAYERAQILASGWRYTFMDKLKEVNKVSENWTAIGSTTYRRTDKICSLNLTGVIACLK